MVYKVGDVVKTKKSPKLIGSFVEVRSITDRKTYII